ncbi:MAG: hypothetical protein ACI9D4_002004 [Polaribacter sp.]|jgi:hypothetical protein
MNLENLNLVELNAQEVQETEGGILILIPFAVAYWAGGLSLAASAITVAAYLGYQNNK